jgi:hypothetical protein
MLGIVMIAESTKLDFDRMPRSPKRGRDVRKSSLDIM